MIDADTLPKEYEYLVPMLTKKAMSLDEITIENKKHGVKKRADTVVYAISNRYPVYDVSPGVFKILTKEDLDNYEATHRGMKYGK